MSGVAHSSYSGRGILCNGFFAGALDRLLGEAFPGEVARRSRPSSPLGDDALGSGMLGLEARERLLDQLGSDASPLEVMADQEIARATPSEEICAPPGQPAVVDRTRTHEPLDGLVPQWGGYVPPRQPFVELSLRQVAVRDRPRCPLQSLVLTEPAPQPTSPLAVELNAHVEAG